MNYCIHKPNEQGEAMSHRCHVKTPIHCVAALTFVCLPALAHAGLYKCIDENTKAVTYSGTACASGTESANMDGKTAQREIAGKQDDVRQAPSATTASTAAPNDSAAKKRLAAECAAGYKGYENACKALRTLNGEVEKKPNMTNCSTLGSDTHCLAR